MLTIISLNYTCVHICVYVTGG